MRISKKAWTFPGRPYYYILYFQKLIKSPTTVRQKEERDIPGPRDNLEGKSCLADSFLVLVAPEGTYWAPRAYPYEEELPCRFLSPPVTLSWFGHILATPDNLFLKLYYLWFSFCLSHVSFFIYFEYLPDIYLVCKYFLPFHRLHLILLIISFAVQKLF